MIDILKERKTIRKYSDEDVSDDLLNEILEAGIRASTTGNMQVYSIVITRDRKMKEALAPLHFNQPMMMQAPVSLTFCADFNRFKKWCHNRNATPCYDNFLSFMTAAIDAIIVAQTVSIAAESKGLGICYLGTAIYMAEKIIDVLNLPAGVVPVTTLTIGWPAEDPEQVDRLPLDGVIHRETYADYTGEDIDRLYSEKESRDDSKQFITENRKETLAQVFTDVRYKKSDNETFSELLMNVLRKQGFM